MFSFLNHPNKAPKSIQLVCIVWLCLVTWSREAMGSKQKVSISTSLKLAGHPTHCIIQKALQMRMLIGDPLKRQLTISNK